MRDLTNYCERRETARELRRTQTDAERHLWARLRNRRLHGLKFRRQFPVGSFFADFLCLDRRLIIEVDGRQHAESQAEDLDRTHFLAEQGFKVIRFWNNDVLKKTDSVCKEILNEANKNSDSQPLPEGEDGASPGEAKKC